MILEDNKIHRLKMGSIYKIKYKGKFSYKFINSISEEDYIKINSEKVLYGLFVGSDIQEDYLKKNYFLINNKIYYALLPLIEFEKIYFEELY